MALGLLAPLVLILVVGAVIAVVVFVVQRGREGASLVLSLRTILVAYFHLMSLIAVLLLAVGLATLLKAALSEPLGRSFSYQSPMMRVATARVEVGPQGQVKTGPPPEVAEEQRKRDEQRVEQEFRNDLLQGGAMAVVGAVVWPLHAWGRRTLTGRGEPAARFFDRTHMTLLLLITSLVGVISLPLGMYEGLRYFIVPAEVDTFRQPPGGAVATALVFVPLWAVNLLVALRRMRREDAGVQARSP